MSPHFLAFSVYWGKQSPAGSPHGMNSTDKPVACWNASSYSYANVEPVKAS